MKIKALLTLLLLMVCSVVGAQTTVTFTAGTEKGSTNGNGTPDSVSKAGITI